MSAYQGTVLTCDKAGCSKQSASTHDEVKTRELSGTLDGWTFRAHDDYLEGDTWVLDFCPDHS